MADEKGTDRTGRGIAAVFAYGGWTIAAVGAALAIYGAMRAETVGAAVAATGPGLGIAIFGLFSVLVAAQTRAALDTADMTREMLRLARQSGQTVAARPASVAALRTAGSLVRAAAPEPAPKLRAAATSEAELPTSGTKLSAPPRTAPVGTKVHPIFSARPPR